MKGLLFLLAAAGSLFAQSPKDFVGTWKSDSATAAVARRMELDGNVIVLTEVQPGGNGADEVIIVRKLPTDGSAVKMDSGAYNGATAVGKMEGSVLTVDTTLPNGTKVHEVWTLAGDKNHYSESRGGARGPVRFTRQG